MTPRFLSKLSAKPFSPFQHEDIQFSPNYFMTSQRTSTHKVRRPALLLPSKKALQEHSLSWLSAMIRHSVARNGAPFPPICFSTSQGISTYCPCPHKRPRSGIASLIREPKSIISQHHGTASLPQLLPTSERISTHNVRRPALLLPSKKASDDPASLSYKPGLGLGLGSGLGLRLGLGLGLGLGLWSG